MSAKRKAVILVFLSFSLLTFSSCFQGPSAMEGRGWASMDMGEFEEAVGFFDTAIEKWSEDKYDYCPPYCGKAIAYTYLGRWEEVIPVCDELISMECGMLFGWPKTIDAWPYIRKGIAHLNLGDLDAAMADFDAALGVPTATDIERYEAHVGRGHVLFETGEYEACVKELSLAVAVGFPFETIINKQDYTYYCYYYEKDAYILRGEAFEKMGMKDEAMDDYKRAGETGTQ
ncbi:MAG: tetratricopeptide repeat protein [Deltaproteobacteria bacterium]|nr:tetratricopeptide repeat protein [Candidatus Zymogenaceae bacterium]